MRSSKQDRRRKSPTRLPGTPRSILLQSLDDWNDGSTSTGELGGKLGGSKLKLTGAFSPNDPVFPPAPMKVVLNNFPASPCVASSTPLTGSLAIFTG
jgi:hypothetical protein